MMDGADHIKICSSGGVKSATDGLMTEQFRVDEIKAISDTVRMMVGFYPKRTVDAQGGTRVTAHCFTSQGARNAIEGGVTCIEHGALIDEPTFKLMAEKGIHFGASRAFPECELMAVPTLLIQVRSCSIEQGTWLTSRM